MKELESLVNENEPRHRGEPRHARCYCVATAAGVATVVGGVASAGASVYGAMKDKGGAGGGGSASDLYGSKIKPVKFKSNVDLPSYHSIEGARDYLTMLPMLRGISQRITDANTVQRERIMPGSKQIMKNAATNLIAMSRGQVAGDVMDVTNQAVAERTGGGMNPGSPDSYAASGSQGATDFARMIGRTSQQNVNDFLSVAPTWEQLADKFVYKAEDAAGMAVNLLQTRAQYILGAGELQNKIDENTYTGQVNYNRTTAMPNPQAVGQRNDQMLQQAVTQLGGGSGGGYLTAINGVVGGLQGVLSGYGQIKGGVQANKTPLPAGASGGVTSWS